jgi:hypothetical protein
MSHSSLNNLDILIITYRLHLHYLLLLLLDNMLLNRTILLWEIFGMRLDQLSFLLLLYLLIVLILYVLVVKLVLLRWLSDYIHVGLHLLLSVGCCCVILGLILFLIYSFLRYNTMLTTWKSRCTLHLHMLYILRILHIFLWVNSCMFILWF